ncbi:MAG: serine/threonine-protein kinase HipA [Thiomicrorhabdus sp.]|nr:MAG: serine/threonine-protein kinase HipA [Thiomicrorhabdus sp.]
MSDITSLFVYNLDQQLVGRLSIKDELNTFQYAKSYVNGNNPLAINPIALPLIQGKTFISSAGFSGALASFTDSMPGSWGRAALKAICGKRLTDLELLLENQQDRLGNLVFATEMQYPDISASRIKEPFEWEQILKAKKQFEVEHRFDRQYHELFKQGASQGGARPKLTVVKEANLYIAKLPTINDYENKAQIEHGSLVLAQTLGIEVAESSFIRIKENSDILLSKRFDFDQAKKRPYLSMASILGVNHSFEASYADFARALKRLNGGLDGVELFKRMVFNAMISNHDDHFQNHAVYFKNGLWRLTPAFDILIGEGNRRSQAIQVGSKGAEKTIANLVSLCTDFDLKKSEALEIIDKMAQFINLNWQEVLAANGIEDQVIQSISWAVLSDISDLILDTP